MLISRNPSARLPARWRRGGADKGGGTSEREHQLLLFLEAIVSVACFSTGMWRGMEIRSRGGSSGGFNSGAALWE